jgi:hypothetical protein
MSAEPAPIAIDPESELGRALDETGGPIIVLRGNKKFRVTRVEEDDLWASYDPDLVLQRLNEVAGKISDQEADRLLELVYRGRREGTRPPDRP